MIHDVTSAAQTGANAGTTGSANAFGTLDKDAFLKLLVAQLRYQNPMAPKDGQEYLAQAAQFAMVEKLDQVGKAQNEAIAYQQVLLATTFVGKQVSGVPEGAQEAITGRVSSVVFDKGTPQLVVGGKLMPVSAVGFVSESST
ncbi:MAG: flagellar hook capping FlgD N-terminal domain-containing protein [Acidimicrobiales bacterium]|nr:flagellar hook capping FlgD N-terminal domain-containing protein [Acidimicrobiales bacterium]